MPERVNILGVGVSTTNIPEVLERVEACIAEGGKGYVCVTGVHGIMESQRDDGLKRILNQSFLNVPDGMPTVWIGRGRGHKTMRRVYGPDLMLDLCEESVRTGRRHFFYGGKEGVADALKAELESRYPGLQVVGTYCPPFRPLNEEEEAELAAMVRDCKPDVLWVGLSTPKQERFMAAYLHKLEVNVMFGVGAAFDIHTGSVKDAPDWVKQSGLQWFHRLLQEPRRLWRRYLVNNPIFVGLMCLQTLRLKQFPLLGRDQAST